MTTVVATLVFANGLGSILLAVLLMAYLGPAIALALHRIITGGYLDLERDMSVKQRAYGVVEALWQGLLWLPMLVLLLVRALLGE